MKEYYLQRLHWIFHYKNRKFFYCLFKTLCLIVGVPVYAVCFVLEMLFTAINMIFSWIPVLNMVVMVICKALVWLFGSTFYICILPDLKEYRAANKEVDYEVEDADANDSATDPTNEPTAELIEDTANVAETEQQADVTTNEEEN